MRKYLPYATPLAAGLTVYAVTAPYWDKHYDAQMAPGPAPAASIVSSSTATNTGAIYNAIDDSPIDVSRHKLFAIYRQFK